MGLKETPTNFRVYYKTMRLEYARLKDEAIAALEGLTEIANEYYSKILDVKDKFKTDFKLNLDDYEEFVKNEYIDGTFFKVAKGAFFNRKNNYVLVHDLFNLVFLAKKQKEINDIKKDIELYDKLISLTLKEYCRILNVFYSQVHRYMIIKGYGYVFEESLGWICINRCKIDKSKSHIDYAATKRNKERLLAEGKKIYNKEEAAWHRERNLSYDAVDARVFLKDEYCYEVPLIDCKLPDGRKHKLELSDYRGREIRGKSNDQLCSEANNDLETICNYPLGLSAKLSMCLSSDKTLYTNFIRNENQKPINAVEINR